MTKFLGVERHRQAWDTATELTKGESHEARGGF